MMADQLHFDCVKKQVFSVDDCDKILVCAINNLIEDFSDDSKKYSNKSKGIIADYFTYLIRNNSGQATKFLDIESYDNYQGENHLVPINSYLSMLYKLLDKNTNVISVQKVIDGFRFIFRKKLQKGKGIEK